MARKLPLNIQAKRRYSFNIETVFNAFLDPNIARKFMFATPTGTMIKAEIDPRVDGTFVFVERRANVEAEHYGRFTEITKNQRIRFVFSVEKYGTETDDVSIEFIGHEPTASEIILTHVIKPEHAIYKDKILKGWQGILQGLETALTVTTILGRQPESNL
jgi:uncharacterized protein YndB with AHSA1/START domain